jgi:hypothetical protein
MCAPLCFLAMPFPSLLLSRQLRKRFLLVLRPTRKVDRFRPNGTLRVPKRTLTEGLPGDDLLALRKGGPYLDFAHLRELRPAARPIELPVARRARKAQGLPGLPGVLDLSPGALKLTRRYSVAPSRKTPGAPWLEVLKGRPLTRHPRNASRAFRCAQGLSR